MLLRVGEIVKEVRESKLDQPKTTKKNLHKEDKSHIKWESFTRKAREELGPKCFSSMCVLILLQPYRSFTNYVRIIMLFDIIISSTFIMNKLLNFICEIINYIFGV